MKLGSGRPGGGRAVDGALLLPVLALAAVILACDAGEPPISETRPGAEDSATQADLASGFETAAGGEPPELVDTSFAPAVAGEDGWMYSQSAEADLDGDGVPERTVITAHVEMIRGRPAWDDGQRWQVYVEEPEGHRTYLYARFVQLGTVTMRIGRSDGSRPPTVVLIEHVPDRVAIYEIHYEGPGSARAVTRFERLVDPTGELASPDLP